MTGIQFGSFTGICETAALVICPLVGTAQGVEPKCYSRNVDVGGTLIFQPCTSSLISLSSLTIGVWETRLTFPSSNVFCPHRRHHHDRNYDPAHPE